MGVFLGVISGLIQLGSAMFFIYTVQMKAGIMRVILRLRHKISPHSRCTVRAGADRVGFEPTELSFDGFQDRFLRPLGHLSSVFMCIRRLFRPFPMHRL